jgi:hypothetical protein
MYIFSRVKIVLYLHTPPKVFKTKILPFNLQTRPCGHDKHIYIQAWLLTSSQTLIHTYTYMIHTFIHTYTHVFADAIISFLSTLKAFHLSSGLGSMATVHTYMHTDLFTDANTYIHMHDTYIHKYTHLLADAIISFLSTLKAFHLSSGFGSMATVQTYRDTSLVTGLFTDANTYIHIHDTYIHSLIGRSHHQFSIHAKSLPFILRFASMATPYKRIYIQAWLLTSSQTLRHTYIYIIHTYIHTLTYWPKPSSVFYPL